ncbi:MAG: hypothetical protein NVS3B7_07470 [Candidatus Elarobacter sp.]
MIVEETVALLLVPAAALAAAIAAALMLLHVARRYRTSPKLVPIGLRFDGRPRRLVPKAMLWLAPVFITVFGTIAGVMLLTDPARDTHRTITVLALVLLAQIAAFVAWTTDRQLELARKQTFRIAPSRMLLVIFPLLATALALAIVAIHDNPY